MLLTDASKHSFKRSSLQVDTTYAKGWFRLASALSDLREWQAAAHALERCLDLTGAQSQDPVSPSAIRAALLSIHSAAVAIEYPAEP